MLLAIRDKTRGIFSAIILGLVMIPFVLWGTYSYFDSGQQIYIAKVNGDGIRYNTYRLTLDRYTAANLNPDILASPAFKRRIVDGLIEQRLLSTDVIEQGYRVSDAKLDRMILQLPNFQIQGKFNQQLYESMLRREDLTPSDFRSRLRVASLTDQIRTGLVESAFITNFDRSAYVVLILQERKITFVRIDSKRFADSITITSKDVENYYSTNINAFKNPEQVRIAFLRLNTSDMVKGYRLSEEELRAAYESESARFTIPAVRRASHILLELPASSTPEDENKAKKTLDTIQTQLTQGKSFASLAKKYSEDPLTANKGGDFGTIILGMLPPEVQRSLVLLKPGEVSKPVRSKFGFHLIRLTHLTPEVKRSFAQVRPELEELMSRRKAEVKFIDDAENLKNLVYVYPDSLKVAAEELGLAIEKSEWFTRTGGVGVTANPKVVKAVFSDDVLRGKHNSDVIEISADSFVTLRVLEHREATPIPLKQVEAKIRRQLRQERAATEAKNLGQELLKQLQSGSFLASLAKKHSLKLEKPSAFQRDRHSGIGNKLASAVFTARPPRADKPVYGGVDLGKKGYAVYELKAITDGRQHKTDPTLQQNIDRTLIQQRGEGMFAGYLESLKADADIKIFENKL